jgi:hypothetical protein
MNLFPFAIAIALTILAADNAPQTDDAFQIALKKHEDNLKKTAEIFDGHKVVLTTAPGGKTKLYECPNWDKCSVIAELKPGIKFDTNEGKIEKIGFQILLFFKIDYREQEAWIASWLAYPVVLVDKKGKPFASTIGIEGSFGEENKDKYPIVHILCDSDNPELVQRVQERFQTLCHAKQVFIYKSEKEYSAAQKEPHAQAEKTPQFIHEDESHRKAREYFLKNKP